MKSGNMGLNGRRLVALCIDTTISLVIGIILVFISFALLYILNVDRHFLYAIFLTTNVQFFIVALPIFFKDVLFKKGSIGKRVMKIEVVSDNGDKPSNYQLVLRNLFIILGPIEALVLLFNDRRLGDMVFHTKVVYKK